jgi:hypothetical protein
LLIRMCSCWFPRESTDQLLFNWTRIELPDLFRRMLMIGKYS